MHNDQDSPYRLHRYPNPPRVHQCLFWAVLGSDTRQSAIDEEGNIRFRYSSCYQGDVLLICYLGWIHSLNFACTTVPSKGSNVPLPTLAEEIVKDGIGHGGMGLVVGSPKTTTQREGPTDQEFKILPKAEVAPVGSWCLGRKHMTTSYHGCALITPKSF